MPVPRVVIFEPNHTGHHFFYVSLVAEAAISAGSSPVLVTTAEATQSAEFDVHLARFGSDLLVESASAGQEPLEIFRRSCRQSTAAAVVPDADRLLKRLWLLSSIARTCPLSLLLMRSPTRPNGGWSVRSLPIQAAKYLCLVLLGLAGSRLSLFLLTAPEQNHLELPLRLVPRLKGIEDPVVVRYSSAQKIDCRRELGLDLHRPLVGIMGGISARKSPGLVAEAVESLRAERPELRLLLIGRAEKDALTEPVTRGLEDGWIELIDSYLDEDTFARYLASLDCLVCAHTNNAPSGLLAHGIAARVPVIAAGAPLLTAQLRSRTGWVGELADLSVAGLRDAISKVLQHQKTDGLRRATDAPSGPVFGTQLLGALRDLE